ncbi:membrane protein insertase YidC [Modestobacter versicolor]|uniref:Membrane protein insertase YidC n=1 Tax=Modestobacter versicolor TaxID=429133 RepID=A0A323VCR5_9ACTN|nr:membrane protein insertase YidC [Modestobacter versicolor]MBB3677357.1 YidC/Oxa1 family membrane protein insertase [Modestobacter versicolor]PZA21970.1 membrane protein insertase YidC [Modestobacter versicolor]
MYTAIAWVMKQWHALFSTFLDPAGGITWALSIVFLVITIRILLFRLFVKQVKSQRAMQEIQPEIQKLRKQYGADKQGFSQAMMALQKERGVNPLAGCLPLLPQIPVFIALFHVLRRLAPGKDGLYSWDDALTDQASKADLFGAPISSSFNMTGEKADAILALPGVTTTSIRIVAFALIVIMCATTFFTQKQIQKRSGPVEGQAAMVQKLLLYGMPLSLFVSGFFFPIGVLLYWFTNNLWTLGQQFYILKKLPPPGSPAALAKAGADKPQIDPKTLAPKPGAKPVRPKPGRPATAAPTSTVSTDGSAVDAPSVDGTPGDGVVGATEGAAGGSANGRPAGGGNRPRTGSTGSRSAPGPANRGKRKRR